MAFQCSFQLLIYQHITIIGIVANSIAAREGEQDSNHF